MADEITPMRGEGRSFAGISGTWGELLSEFFGTFLLICFGDGVVAMAVAALPGSGRAATSTTIFQASGDWLLITFGWAFAVALAVYVAGGVSGAHINPAVTLAVAVRRKFPWAKVGPYWIAQVVGAFFGAALVYWIYNPAMHAFEQAAGVARSSGEALATYSIFATFPAPFFHGSSWGPFFTEIVGAAFLLIFVAALTDARNPVSPQSNFGPFMVGIAVAAIGMSFGANSGYAINPARDFGPRLFAWIFGWGDVAIPGTLAGSFSNYFWIPIIGPLIGAVIGIILYDWFIGDVLHARKAPPPPGREFEGTPAPQENQAEAPGGGYAGGSGESS
jgi:glycerol uptake facilitator protein